jgi:hypothetical protein
MDRNEILKVLMANKDKNFVNRILIPELWPFINNPDGSYSTHRMSTGEYDGKNIAYPEIIYEQGRGLIQLSPEEALKHAIKTREFIQFDSPDLADDFSKTYKTIWDK